MQRINIHSKNSTINLLAIRYYIDIVGGFHVKKNGFKFKLTNVETGEIIVPTNMRWMNSSFCEGERSKRCYEIYITNAGQYSITFTNSEALQVKRSSLILNFFFSKSIPNTELEICIYRKN